MIVNARQKPVEQLPEWALCCDATRKIHVSEEELGRVVRVRTGTTFLAEAECMWCHQITPERAYMMEIDRKGRAIAVDLFDFDEGESQ